MVGKQNGWKNDSVLPLVASGEKAEVGAVKPKYERRHSTTWQLLQDTKNIEGGSISSSVFTLVTSIVGVGILSLPTVLKKSGLVLGLIFLACGGVMAYFSVHLLIVCSQRTGKMSYGGIARVSMGVGWEWFSRGVIMLNLFGSTVAYITACSNLTNLTVHTLFGEEITFEDSAVLYLLTQKWFVSLFVGVTVLFPFGLLKNLDSLRFSSLFSLLCVIFLTFAVIYKSFDLCLKGANMCFLEAIASVPKAKLDFASILDTVPLVVYAYTCHPNVLPVFLAMQRPTKERKHRVTGLSMFLAVALYGTLSAFVFLTFGDETQGNFLVNDFGSSYLIITGTVGLCISMLFACVIFTHASRMNINHAFFPQDDEEEHPVRHVAVTFAFVALAVGVTCLVRDIEQVLSILGATTNPIICYVLPCAYFMHVAPEREARGKLLVAITLATTISLIGGCSIYIKTVESF